MSRIVYRPEIDGLRAIAVLSVVLYHAGVGGFSGGYVGVDVFFVISGYLITSILLTDLAAGTFSLRSFYERRARRILPPLLLVLSACIPAAWLWLTPAALAEFGASVGYACAFLANLFFYDHSDYFDGEVALKPLAHTWSLAVEEQYYLAFPLLLWALRKAGRTAALGVMIALALASLAYSEYMAEHEPQAAFYLLPARIWELLVGALVAYLLAGRAARATVPPGRTLHEAAGIGGLLLIGFSVMVFDAETSFPGLSAVLPTIGTCLVIAAAAPTTLVGRVLASAPFVLVGLVSYSTYLWHQPLLAFLRHATDAEPGSALTVTVAMASLLLGYLSWRFVEAPFRDASRVSSRVLFASIALPTLALSLAGWKFYEHDGFEAYYYAHRASEAEKRVRELQQARRTSQRSGERHADDGACRFRADTIDEAFRTRFSNCAALHGPAVVVIGDSHAMNVHNALHGAGFGQPFLVGLIKGGCRAENLRASCPYAEFERFARHQRAVIRQVVYHQSGSYFIADPQGKVDSGAAFAKPGSYTLRSDHADRAMSYLDRLAETVPTVWLGPFAEARVDLAKPAGRDGALKMNEVALQAFGGLDRELQSVAQLQRPKWRYVSMLAIVPMDRDFLVQGDCLTFQDADHLSACGEGLVGERLARGLQAQL